MGSLKSAEWYDDALTRRPYTDPVTGNPFEPIWCELARRVPDGLNVVEYGCGPGHLASIVAPRAASYLGLDFSPAAILAATRRNIARATFAVVDLAHGSDERGDVVVACEFLEHVEDDVGILSRIRSGTRVIASVPSRDSESHVRWFTSIGNVLDRYGPVGFVDLSVVPFHEWYILEGVRR